MGDLDLSMPDGHGIALHAGDCNNPDCQAWDGVGECLNDPDGGGDE